jgi:uncharacterized protein
MATQSAGTHEPPEKLSAMTMDLHRALVSLMEELEAVDWYQQRVDATSDDELKRILAHNRDEEIEHAAMTLEWIRRTSPTFDRILRTYLFTSGEITELEAEDKNGAPEAAVAEVKENGGEQPGLTVGSLITKT